MDIQHSRPQNAQPTRNRLLRLREVSLRISESLDFHEVIQCVLDSARSITAARTGVMVLMDDQLRPQEYLSSGLTREESLELWERPKTRQIFDLFTEIKNPLRIPDLVTFVRSRGITDWEPPRYENTLPFMSVPLYHRGIHIGQIFLGDKDHSGEFTDADEEILIMFAAQAAMTVTNARLFYDFQKAKEGLDKLVDTSPVGVVVLNLVTGVPELVNHEAMRILLHDTDHEQPPHDLLERVTFLRPDGEELPITRTHIADSVQDGKTIWAEEITLRVAGGTLVNVLINATPFQTQNNQVTTVLITLQDMTPLEAQERLRADFLAMVSRELRAPLAAVNGAVATVLESEEELGPLERTQFLNIIRDQSDQMRFLLRDLLDVARIETGSLSVSPTPTNLQPLVEEARTRFLGEGDFSIEVELPTGLPWIMADRRRIVQVLMNLFSNAVRFTHGTSTIVVKARLEGSQVAASVESTGSNIPEKMMSNLFRKYFRTSKDRTWGGPGLAICKGIVEAHGGHIRVENDRPSDCTRFIFTLPVATPPNNGNPNLVSRRYRATTSRQLRVLAVDNDPQALRYVRDILKKEGYAPILTSDPKDVPRIMAWEKPHLVLLDMVLPGSDGIAVMEAVFKIADVPVIFLSAHNHDETVSNALDMGASDYLVKPFSPIELTSRLRAALRSRQSAESEVPAGPYNVGGLTIDFSHRKVTKDGVPVSLTATEYAVLHELAANAPKVLTHNIILERAWGPERVGEPWLVRDIIKRLRHKLDDPADNPTYIITQPRVGYHIATDSEEPETPET